MPVEITVEETPNPQTMKFNFDQNISEFSAEYKDSLKTQASPLAAKLFGFPWMSAVYIGQNFVTITKQDWVDWDVLRDPLAGLLKEHIESEEPVQLKVNLEESQSNESDTDQVKIIKSILETEIQPAVAMDGGNIIFVKYEDHVVYLEMQGACAGCPSSMMTLKDGVETRLKQALPEIQGVLAVNN